MMKQKLEALTDKRTVLVVEDNEMNREILCDLLEDDYRILEAENGQVGLEQMEQYGDGISVVLLDVFMPVCDGFEFLERKQNTPYSNVPVIVMTGSDTADDELRCLELGATDFVTKPYNIDILKNRMQSLIRLRESATMINRLELDDLTKLFSREFFYQNVEDVLRANPDVQYDIVCSDIENFRTMNDRYGQAKCDQFLSLLAKRLTGELPDLVLGGRIGSDVYGFLLEHQDGIWTSVLRQPDPKGEFSHFVIKYGVLEQVDHSLPAATLCDRATLALSHIKGKFNANVAWFNDEMRQLQLREFQIVESMESSMANREFQVYFQPKHLVKTGEVGGAEALVRWTHPQLGFISPGMFIPLFEKNGFITKLDFYIWEEVCIEIRRCMDAGLPVVPISTNVSRMDFDVEDLAEQITALVDRYGIDHSLFHVELTESSYSDNPARIENTLQKLHDNGFVIELDDFGSGYSTLTALHTMPIDIMKLDMSLIRHASATNDYSILRYVVLLAEVMRLKTVAEGAETTEQVEALRVLGCDYIQGYYFSKPLPRREYEEYVMTNSGGGRD